MPSRQELQELVDSLDEPQAERVLRLVRSELAEPAKPVVVWPPAFFGAAEGEPDASERVDEIIAERFREQ